MSHDDELGHTIRRTDGAVATPSNDKPLPVEPEGRFAVPDGLQDIELGRGGMGRVLRLRDVHLGRDVAIKELLPDQGDGGTQNPKLAALFIREAQVLARLDHPGVVPIYELGKRSDGRAYYAMRRIRGRTLAKCLDDAATLSDRLALLPHLLNVAQTMAFAHHRGVIHRDLKPENVMIGEFGETLVVDWGLALLETEAVAEGHTAGTPAYMPPEQAAGQKTDKRTDVWSLGVMLFELLAGRLPFDAKTGSDMVSAVQKARIPPVKEFEPGAPAAIAKVAQKALQRDPSARYDSAETFAQALQAAMVAQGPSPLRMPILAAVMTVMAVGLGLWALQLKSTGEQQQEHSERIAARTNRAEAALRAQLAAAAFKNADLLTAERESRAALALSPDPLARGVSALVKANAGPRELWSHKTEAGCSAVLMTGSRLLCATLNGVAEFSSDDGMPSTIISNGARGWQRALTINADTTLAFGGDDRMVHIVDQNTNTELFHTQELPDTITTLVPVDDGTLVGLANGMVLKLSTSRVVTNLSRETGPIRVLAQKGDQQVIGTPESLSIKSAGSVKGLQLNQGPRAVISLPQGRWLAAVRHELVLLDGNQSSVWHGHHAEITALSGIDMIASGSDDGEVRLWTSDGRLMHVLPNIPQGVSALDVSSMAGKTWVAVAGADRSLRVFEVATTTADAWSAKAPTVSMVDHEDNLFTGYRDGVIERVGTGTLELKHDGAVRALAEIGGEPESRRFRMISGGDDGLVQAQRWSGEVVELEKHVGAKVTAVAANATGTHAAWGFNDGTFTLMTLDTLRPVLTEKKSVVRSLAFNRSGRRVALGRDDKRITIFDTNSGQELAMLDPMNAPASALQFSNNDDAIFAGTWEGQLIEWNIGENEPTFQWAVSDRPISALTLSSDGWHLIVGTQNAQVSVLNRWNHETLMQLPVNAGRITLLSLRANETELLIATDLPKLLRVPFDQADGAEQTPPSEWLKAHR